LRGDENMRCPVCGIIANEFHDKNSITYTCNDRKCSWSGTKEVKKEIKDLDFTFPEVDQMEGIPWYQTSKEWKLKKEAENQKK
jgi:hypothetical protein